MSFWQRLRIIIRGRKVRQHQLFWGHAVRYTATNLELRGCQMGPVIRLLVGALIVPRGYHKITLHMVNTQTDLFLWTASLILLFIVMHISWCLLKSTDKLTGNMWIFMHISYLSFSTYFTDVLFFCPIMWLSLVFYNWKFLFPSFFSEVTLDLMVRYMKDRKQTVKY